MQLYNIDLKSSDFPKSRNGVMTADGAEGLLGPSWQLSLCCPGLHYTCKRLCCFVGPASPLGTWIHNPE